MVPKPIHYRYAWARNLHANLVSGWDKLPLATQRSDSWTMSDLYTPQVCGPELFAPLCGHDVLLRT